MRTCSKLCLFLSIHLYALSASWVSLQDEQYESCKFIHQAEGYSCYESFVDEMTNLIREEATEPSTFPRFTRLLRSIDRPGSYYRTSEYDELPNCHPPMPLQGADLAVLVQLVRQSLPWVEGDKYVDALRCHSKSSLSRIHKDKEAISNLINKNDVSGNLSHIKSITDAMYLLKVLGTSGKQRVGLKLMVEDKILQRFPEVVNFLTTVEIYGPTKRLFLPNRPLLPIGGLESLKFVGNAISGRRPSCFPSSTSTSSLSSSGSSSDESVYTPGSPDSEPNSPPSSLPIDNISEIVSIDKKRCYLRHLLSPSFLSIGALSNRTTLFSELFNSRNMRIEEQIAIWTQANSQWSDDNPAIFAYMRPNQRMAIFSSGANSACWLIRDGKVAYSKVAQQHTLWTVQKDDVIVGICGFNDIDSFDPLQVLHNGADLAALEGHMKAKFNNDSQYSAAFVAQIVPTEQP